KIIDIRKGWAGHAQVPRGRKKAVESLLGRKAAGSRPNAWAREAVTRRGNRLGTPFSGCARAAAVWKRFLRHGSAGFRSWPGRRDRGVLRSRPRHENAKQDEHAAGDLQRAQRLAENEPAEHRRRDRFDEDHQRRKGCRQGSERNRRQSLAT